MVELSADMFSTKEFWGEILTRHVILAITGDSETEFRTSADHMALMAELPENACSGKRLGLHLINQKRFTPGMCGNRPVHSAKVRSLSAVHGLTISMSISSKSLTLRVATAMPRDRAIAAIWQFTGETGRPAERRMSAIIA